MFSLFTNTVVSINDRRDIAKRIEQIVLRLYDERDVYSLRGLR